MSSKRNGLLALLGVGAVAWWKYKNSTPEQKQAVKDTLNTAKDNFSKFGTDLKSKATDMASQVQDKVAGATNSNPATADAGAPDTQNQSSF
ncbi:YtxH domain-containing protein [Kaistella pullorum]|uniref:YtxH domain-containing protein n=1 Tax=Kaistella pullorum TaxID=2763074 RepID=A0ABR8WKW7_9FLAO|nr:YtxH domain-containing protein [Kaistella pullorum]MBD8017518.1 YtxH domain-containing protein [Kaistella pullorum]